MGILDNILQRGCAIYPEARGIHSLWTAPYITIVIGKNKSAIALVILKPRKMLKNCQNYTLVFQHFSFGPPLETMKKKLLQYF